MRSSCSCLLALLLGVAALLHAAEPHHSLPPPVIPDCLGVNIHFTDPKPGEMEMLAAAGFRWVRMDFGWGGTERVKGQYDFSAYDRLAATLARFNIRAVFILDYGNSLYADPGDTSPFTSRGNTPEFREAFAKWAVAAVQHFKGRGYLWEMWNEPNGGFWKSADKRSDYIALAKATGEALRHAALLGPKGEAFIGPATSTIDLPYLEACFQAGLLDYWDAVSVHPYRQNAPETVEEEYRSLRLLIRKYAPKDKAIPILSGEWGYSSAWTTLGKDEAVRAELQGKYLPREFLTNIANDVALSIWYDWHDDGPNPKEGEHRFGIVGHEYHPGRDPVYDPKPAYKAIRLLSGKLGGMRFSKRILVEQQNGREQEETRALVFSKEDTQVVALWNAEAHVDSNEETCLPSSAGDFHLVPISSGRRPYEARAGDGELTFKTADLDLIVVQPQKPNDFLRIAAASPRLPLDFVYRWPTEKLLPIPTSAEPAGLKNGGASSASSSLVTSDERGLLSGVRNPFDREIRLLSIGVSGRTETLRPGEIAERRANVEDFSREPRRRKVEEFVIELDGRPVPFQQATTMVCLNPLTIEAYPPVAGSMPVRISNSSGEPILGVIETIVSGWLYRSEPIVVPLKAAAGDREKIVYVPLPEEPKIGKLHITIRQDFETEHVKMVNEPVCDVELPGFGVSLQAKMADLRVIAEGDASAGASSQLADALPQEGPPLLQAAALRLSYHFGAGWKFLRVSPTENKIAVIDRDEGIPPLSPVGFGCWLYGDGKGCQARIRFVDATGQTFQPDGKKIVWTGWKYVSFPMTSTGTTVLSHWGGANDGTVHYPIKWDSLFLLDNVSRKEIEGEIFLSAPTLLY